MPIDLLANSPEPRDLLAKPRDLLAKDTPWHQKEVNLPSWIDRGKWDSAVKDLETSFTQFVNPEQYAGEAPGLSSRFTKAATNPITVAEGLTSFITEIPGFLGGVVGAAQGLAKRALGGDIDLEDYYNAAAEGFQKESAKVQEYLPAYHPKSEGAELVGETLMAPASAAMMLGHDIADSEAVDSLPSEVKHQVKGLLKFAGDIGGLALQGKVMHGVKGKKAKAPAPTEADLKLDTTYAKDLVMQRIAQERAATKQKPLDTLARKEESLAAEPSPEQIRQQQIEKAFTEVPEVTDVAAFDYKPRGRLPESPQVIDVKPESKAPVVADPAYLMDRATEKLGGKTGGKAERAPIDLLADTTPREYGLKILDRSIPEPQKAKAQAMVDGLTKEGKSAEQAAAVFDSFLKDNQTLKGKVELEKRLSEESAQGQAAEVAPNAPSQTKTAAPDRRQPIHTQGGEPNAVQSPPSGASGVHDRRVSPDRRQDTTTRKHAETTKQFNTEHPGSSLKYDGVQDRSAINKPPLHNFTAYEGPAKGATFSLENPTIENIKAKLDEMVDLRTQHEAKSKDYAALKQKAADAGISAKDIKRAEGEVRGTFEAESKAEKAQPTPEGSSPQEVVPRSTKEILKDINTAIGKRGEIGTKDLTPDQKAAYDRLSKDILVIRRNARRVGKDVGEYLNDLGQDAKVVSALAENADKLVENAAKVYGSKILEKYGEAAKKDDPKYAQSVNLEKQNIPQSAKNLEQAIAGEKQTISWKDIEVRSDKVLPNKRRTEATFKRLDKLTGGKLTADLDVAREVNAKIETIFGGIIEKYKKGELKTDEFNSRIKDFSSEEFRITSEAQSEVGRALNSFKKEVSGLRVARSVEKIKKDLNPRQMKEFVDITKKLQDGTLTHEQLRLFEKQLPDPKLSDYLTEFWYNSILSGPPTHVVNIAGNTLWTMYQIPHRMASAPVDAVWQTLRGRQRTRFMNEVMPMLAGYKTGFKKGRVAAGDMFRKGKIEAFDTKWAEEMGTAHGAFERSPNPMLRKLAPYLTVATKGLRAMDVWGKAIAFDGHINALARRASNLKGLKGEARKKFEAKFRNNPPQEAFTAAIKQADYSTFMDVPDPLTNLIIKTREIPVVGTGLRLTIMPFVNTISNLTKRGVEMTPGLGLAKAGVSAGMRRGFKSKSEGVVKSMGKKWAENKKFSAPDIIAKQIEGAVMSFIVLNLVADGKITGPMPESKPEREAWHRQGKKPWSIRVGDNWYSYRRVEPFNTVIASASMFYEKILNAPDEKTATERFMDFVDAMKWNVLDGSYFAGVQAFFNRHGKRGGMAARAAAGWVPYSGFWRSINRAVEVVNEGAAKPREGNEWLKSFSQVIPGLSGKMPAKLNVWGDEAVIPGGVFRQWLPFKWAQQIDDPVEKELEAAGYFPSLPPKTITIRGEKVELGDEDYRRYCIDYGSRLKARFAKIIDRKAWKHLDPEAKAKILKKNRLKIGRRSRQRLIKELAKSKNK